MSREKAGLPAKEAEETGFDYRERFVLRGGLEGIPESVPEEPEVPIDIERTLESLGDAPHRPRVRRHSQL
jgi:hypothetical protein